MKDIVKATWGNKELKDKIINWIQKYFEENGPESKAVIGISGGVDSSVVATLCKEALGKDRVLGVLMPNGLQHDIDISRKLTQHLEIDSLEINIEKINLGMLSMVGIGLDMLEGYTTYKERLKINTPARIRASLLYNLSDYIGGRVANTSNLSEDYIGYNTKFGDTVGDFAPLMDLTKTEVFQLAKDLGLPPDIAEKIPEDGLTGLTDEMKLGFSYDALDNYIRTGICEDSKLKEKIDTMHKNSIHKISPPHIFRK